MKESSHLYIKEIHVIELVELVKPSFVLIVSTGVSPFLA
jgi:hypothetical protein